MSTKILGPSGTIYETSIWHCGDPFSEQRIAAEIGGYAIDNSVAIVSITGTDYLQWLNTLTTKLLTDLAVGESTHSLILDAHGKIEYQLWIYHHIDGLYLEVPKNSVSALEQYLQKMIFWANISVTRRDELTVVRFFQLDPQRKIQLTHNTVSRTQQLLDITVTSIVTADPTELIALCNRVVPPLAHVGLWAYEAFRIAAACPRIDIDGDNKTLPHECELVNQQNPWCAVSLNKGCYRGQETVAKIHNLGKPPRRLVLLHADSAWGQQEAIAKDSLITLADKPIGILGSYIDHYLLGPIALGLIKRSTPRDAILTIEDKSLAIDLDFYYEDTIIPPGKAAIARLRTRQVP